MINQSPMKTTSNRRSFLKKIGVSGVTASVLPAAIISEEVNANAITDASNNAFEENRAKRDYNATYKDEFLNRVAFPIGGLGAGMFFWKVPVRFHTCP